MLWFSILLDAKGDRFSCPLTNADDMLLFTLHTRGQNLLVAEVPFLLLRKLLEVYLLFSLTLTRDKSDKKKKGNEYIIIKGRY